MVVYENFTVEAPAAAGFTPGDVVEKTGKVSLRNGFLLDRGFVVAIDTDPAQDVLPVFFIEGLHTVSAEFSN